MATDWRPREDAEERLKMSLAYEKHHGKARQRKKLIRVLTRVSVVALVTAVLLLIVDMATSFDIDGLLIAAIVAMAVGAVSFVTVIILKNKKRRR